MNPTQFKDGVVVGVLRRCDMCDQWKLLTHFVLAGNVHGPTRSVHRCAACRGRTVAKQSAARRGDRAVADLAEYFRSA